MTDTAERYRLVLDQLNELLRTSPPTHSMPVATPQERALHWAYYESSDNNATTPQERALRHEQDRLESTARHLAREMEHPGYGLPGFEGRYGRSCCRRIYDVIQDHGDGCPCDRREWYESSDAMCANHDYFQDELNEYYRGQVVTWQPDLMF